ncbi:MAG: hypothetical protein KAJ95_04780, partial [Gammaproteobacteria bacterium]|nr:hypothetical protein [Gammaproteobacteria bacterium]
MTKESDEIKIEHEQDYREIAKTISRKKRPAKILRKLMNMMEAYRQSKKYGWSRPWNKHNLTNFQSFKLDHRNDELLYLNSQRFLSEMFSGAPEEVRVFSEGLLSDTNELMSFLFCHEYSDGNKHFEGATLSFGRINNKRYRDRIDIILEAEVINGVSQG